MLSRVNEGLSRRVCGGDLHLRIKEASRGLNNSSNSVVSRDLEQTALVVGHDSQDLQAHILGVQVLSESVAEGLGLADLNGSIVLHGGQVAHDGLVGGGSLGEDLGVGEGARDKGDGDGAVFLVGDVDNGAGRLAVDEAQAEDVGVGEGYFDVGLELGGRVDDGGSLRGFILRQCQ